MFSLQELYNVFVSDPEGKDARWERTIVIISSVFRCHLLSEEHFPEYIRSGYDPAFLEFVFANLRKHEHPASSLQISEFTVR